MGGIKYKMNVGQVFECLLGWAAENLNARFKSNLNKGVVGIKWSILIILEESSVLHDGTFKLFARFQSRDGAQGLSA